MDHHIDFSRFCETALALEQAAIAAGESWCETKIAGLQFYDYHRHDAAIGLIAPRPGDRLTLERRPDNPIDRNAVAVRWRDRFCLGHLPADIVRHLAAALDAGTACRAYCTAPGDGRAWSMKALLVGGACDRLHRTRVQRIQQAYADDMRGEVRAGSRLSWPDLAPSWWDIPDNERRRTGPPPPPRTPPTEAQYHAERAFQQNISTWHTQRRIDAGIAFDRLPKPCPGAEVPAIAGLRGYRFAKWADVPVWLKAKPRLRELGYHVPRGIAPFAWLASGRNGAYPLYLARDARPGLEPASR